MTSRKKNIQRMRENPKNVRFEDLEKLCSYEIIIEPNDEGGFYARIPDMPSIFTGGASEEEALKNAKDAVKEYMRVCKEDGLPLPKPKSGKFNVRMPKELHRKLAHKAEAEGVSLNSLITYMLASELPKEKKLKRA